MEAAALAQAAALRHAVRRPDRVFSSLARRTRQTAAALQLEVEEDAALRDLDHGRWAGRALSDIQAENPDGLLLWLTDVDAAPHGGEAVSAMLLRVAAWMEAHAGDRGHTIVVTHAAVVRAAILHVLGAPARAFWLIDVEPLSFTDLRHDGRRWALRAGAPVAV